MFKNIKLILKLDNNKSCYVEKDNIWLMKLMKIT